MSSVVISGNTSGTITLDAPAVAGTTTLTLPATTGTVLTNASQLVGTGTTTNDSAAVGYVGEYVSSTVSVAGPVSLATGTAKTITSISLTAGDWDVNSFSTYNGTATALISAASSISLVNNTLGDRDSARCSMPLPTAGISLNATDATIVVPRVRISIATTTTIYMVSTGTFSGGGNTASCYGTISARRVR